MSVAPHISTPSKVLPIGISIPPQWLTNITVVSRRHYKQRVCIQVQRHGSIPSSTHTFESGSDETRKTMKDILNNLETLAIVPDEHNMELSLTFNYQSGGIEAQSNSCKVLELSKHDADDSLHHTTFLIFIRDEGRAAKIIPDDAVAIVQCLGGFQLPSIREQASSGFWTSFGDNDPPPTDLDPPRPYDQPEDVANLPVCIIGAGAAGLYTAYMLDTLGIDYKILEASGRVGGRLYTHRFRGGSGAEYFDAGAMRFPKIPIMDRFFDLIDKLGMKEKLLPVEMKHENNIFHFNGVRLKRKDIRPPSDSVDQFRVGIGTVPDGYIAKNYLDQGYEKLYNDAIDPLRKLFVDHEKFSDALKQLMEKDDYSVRSYMAQVLGYPPEVINWIETMEWRTGMFDSSLTETVLASLSFKDPKFEHAGQQVEWKRINGGAQVLADALLKKVKKKPYFYRRVVAIKETTIGNVHPLSVTIDCRDDPNLMKNGLLERTYSNIICTLPLSSVRLIDLDGCHLLAGQRNALRELQYSPSIKIGIQFKSAWWEKEPVSIIGGQSYTDRPVRTVVYPSNKPGDSNHPNVSVLIASYNGMQDSQRLGALMRGRDTPEERILLNLVMKDLAIIHGVKVDLLWAEYVDYYPWDWYSSSFSLGAFAWFGPGQFKNIYDNITLPASREQRLFFAGDATSSRHGWVVGALDSAWRCVYSMLLAHQELESKHEEFKGKNMLKVFLELWNLSMEWPEAYLTKTISESRVKIMESASK